MERAQRILGVALLAYILYPLLLPLQPRSLDDIKTWGLKGPGKDLPIPCMGVYVFAGLNPVMTVDMSHAYGYDPKAKSFWLDFTPQSVTVAANGTGASFDGHPKFKSTSPSPAYLPGWYVIKQFSLLRYRVQFRFESDSVAVIKSCIAGCWSPLSWAYNKALGETLERRFGGVWARENYVSLANRTRLSGYQLLPVLLPGGKVNAKGMAYAAGKLAASGAQLKGGAVPA